MQILTGERKDRELPEFEFLCFEVRDLEEQPAPLTDELPEKGSASYFIFIGTFDVLSLRCPEGSVGTVKRIVTEKAIKIGAEGVIGLPKDQDVVDAIGRFLANAK